MIKITSQIDIVASFLRCPLTVVHPWCALNKTEMSVGGVDRQHHIATGVGARSSTNPRLALRFGHFELPTRSDQTWSLRPSRSSRLLATHFRQLLDRPAPTIKRNDLDHVLP
jgi:hypothetical protein